MNKRANIKRIVGVTCVAVTIMLVLLFVLNRITYNSLEKNLEEKLISADNQRGFTLEKQMSVFSISMKGFATSIVRTGNGGIENNKIKLRILLADLCKQLFHPLCIFPYK